MLDKIFNRKYYKALKEIDDEIHDWEELMAKAVDALGCSKSIDEYNQLMSWINMYKHRIEGLEILRVNLKHIK